MTLGNIDFSKLEKCPICQQSFEDKKRWNNKLNKQKHVEKHPSFNAQKTNTTLTSFLSKINTTQLKGNELKINIKYLNIY